MKKELLIKFLNNHCTDAEVDEVYSWIRTNALNEEDTRWSIEVWNSHQETNDIYDDDFYAIFDKIQKKIDDNNSNSNGRESKSLKLFVPPNWLTKAAAILLIPVLTILLYTLSEKRIESDKYAKLAVDSLEVIAPFGSQTVVQLSDGSEVQLNYGSKIKYPYFFSSNTREVTLTGEGFFKVAHNPEKPFIVKAGNLNVKAVGTTFNVLAYPDNNFIETTLVTGKVILEQEKKDGKTETIGTMKPGLHVNYNLLNGSISSTDGNIEKYISWTEGKLIFIDTPILQVTDRLSRMFNVDFEVKDEIKNYTYTVTFTGDPLDQILDLMALATPIDYKILPRKKLPDGSYSKQKVILEKR
ncbi:FecR family protein [Sunxiuqinia indica]|uniref:FecR family protein n=1 Tax=Sunxiuqinia indica TaxID=2692584 RepID=UPI00135AE2C9|nr:FecR family protein [Sunxiuqinia indica]